MSKEKEFIIDEIRATQEPLIVDAEISGKNVVYIDATTDYAPFQPKDTDQ